MAKAYRIWSNEALCVITGMMPIDIKIVERVRLYQLYKLTANNNTHFYKDLDVGYWEKPGEARITCTDVKKETGSLHIYIDGGKSENGVGSGKIIFESGQRILMNANFSHQI